MAKIPSGSRVTFTMFYSPHQCTYKVCCVFRYLFARCFRALFEARQPWEPILLVAHHINSVDARRRISK